MFPLTRGTQTAPSKHPSQYTTEELQELGIILVGILRDPSTFFEFIIGGYTKDYNRRRRRRSNVYF